MSDEEWRSIEGHSGYEISSHGRVRSLDRLRAYTRVDHWNGRQIEVIRIHKGRLLRAGTMPSGHQFVMLGRGNGALVHALVLRAFLGPAPDGTECCHWDDNPANNHIGNLRWGTRSENHADYVRNYGHHPRWGKAA